MLLALLAAPVLPVSCTQESQCPCGTRLLQVSTSAASSVREMDLEWTIYHYDVMGGEKALN